MLLFAVDELLLWTGRSHWQVPTRTRSHKHTQNTFSECVFFFSFRNARSSLARGGGQLFFTLLFDDYNFILLY